MTNENDRGLYRTVIDTIVKVIGMTQEKPYLTTFPDMLCNVFLWALFSSIVVHAIAAVIAFATLRKHHFGKFFPIIILVMGTLAPITSGLVSSAAISFVYRASSLKMLPVYALFWGVGQTVLAAAVGFTRILATL
uniref:Transmembrane protein 170A n=1 Tax=Clastoptera arizonana TaxID=38151 RepID=A0A1B6CSZ3_9HEMI